MYCLYNCLLKQKLCSWGEAGLGSVLLQFSMQLQAYRSICLVHEGGQLQQLLFHQTGAQLSSHLKGLRKSQQKSKLISSPGVDVKTMKPNTLRQNVLLHFVSALLPQKEVNITLRAVLLHLDLSTLPTQFTDLHFQVPKILLRIKLMTRPKQPMVSQRNNCVG